MGLREVFANQGTTVRRPVRSVAMLHFVAIVSLAACAVCALVIAGDIARGRRQNMAVMDVVWPITALYAGPFALYAYFTVGRKRTRAAVMAAQKRGATPPGQRDSLAKQSALGATHCGAGCSLGDIIAEWTVFLAGWTLFGKPMFAAWALDFVVAFAIGIAFQYFTIAPMRHLSLGNGIIAAIKADALSLTAWQVGMYGWMALVVFVLLGHELEKTDPVFWFMMQLAMMAGFLTSWPVNAWLIRKGLKEAM